MGTGEFYRGPSGKMLPGLQLGLEEALQELKNLFPGKPVSLAYVFGSYARGEADAVSDFDLAVLLDKSGEDLYSAYLDVMLEVQRVLGTERLDLLLLNSAPPAMQFDIVRWGRLIYCRNERVLNDFEMNAIRKYQDTAYLRRVQNEYLKKRAREWYSKKNAF